MNQPTQTVLSFLLYFFFIAFFSMSCSQSSSQEKLAIEKDTLQSPPVLLFAMPEDVGLSTDSLKKVDELISRYVKEKKFPGAVVLIAKGGKIIYETEVGWSDSMHTEPYRKDHIFRMASMTKPLTSVAAMQLYEQGKLDLNDPVSKYIPEFADATVLTAFHKEDTTWESRQARHAPTIHHLLTHTSGIPYGFITPEVNGAIMAKYDIPDLATHLDVKLEESMASLGKLPLAHDPGERFTYGLSTDVLGRVVEVASGMSLADYFKKNITGPLGMEDTDFFLDETQASRLVDNYMLNDSGRITSTYDLGKLYDPDFPVKGASYFSGGSGLSGTARDYFVFSQTMLEKGTFQGVQLLKPETAKMMEINQLDTVSFPWADSGFGYGFEVANKHPVKPSGTFYWGGAFSTTFWIDPENEIVAIMLSQVLFGSNEMFKEFENLVYNAMDEENVAELANN
ncbi:beta-lactamase family protein [Fulvivirga sp. 29W222]|uniref:Beta-lactamase family protein n=1 Tax=Fulvivirga marina TaxID=2494733 RepID=A0A937FWA3_9BACT|nr:serine hydrolase domain-containing protein [Fulvivirga marina]MBL6447174.1 beta-lactamase family protein [Fulvivirga marina]